MKNVQQNQSGELTLQLVEAVLPQSSPQLVGPSFAFLVNSYVHNDLVTTVRS